MNRRTYLKSLALLGISGTVAPRLLATPLLQSNQPADTPDETTVFHFRTKPCLQYAGNNSMTIVWITSHDCFSWVEYGETDHLGQKAMTETNGLYQANNHIHKIRLENLSAGKKYTYKVCSKEIVKYSPYIAVYGETIESEISHFTMPSLTQDTVSMLILNDLHENPESVKHLIGLNGNETCDFVCLNGDSINIFDNEQQLLKNVLRPCTETFATTLPLIYVRGNHETRGAAARRLYDYFDTGGNPYYSFSAGPVFLVILDTGEDKEDTHEYYAGLTNFDRYREKQAVWLERELKSPAARKAKFKVVLMHIPPYHSDDWHGTMHCRKVFDGILNKAKTDIVICGHTHRYGVFEPDKNTHKYPIIIGGGPKIGSRTLIKLNATRQQLHVVMLDDTGKAVGDYEINKG